MTFTAEEKLISIRRELAMRKRVYPRWVEMGKMKLDQAEREIALMQAIAADYEGPAAIELGKKPLPGQLSFADRL
jgi:hypothetical protein